jgi:putative heme iron utilization protein
LSEHEFTPDQIEQGIAKAVQEREFDVIPSLVKLLAVQDPHRAQRVLDALHGRVTLTVQLA